MLKKLLALVLCCLACAGALAKTVLIDVRTPEEYAAGHLTGAINIDHQAIAQRIGTAGVGKEDEVILYCRTGYRAGIAYETLKGMGFKHLQNYGGMEDARKKLEQK